VSITNWKRNAFYIPIQAGCNAAYCVTAAAYLFKKTFWHATVHTKSVLMIFTFKIRNNTVSETQTTISFGYSTRCIWSDILWISISSIQSRCLGNQPHSTKANMATNVERCYGPATLGVGTQRKMEWIWGSTEKKNSSMKVKYRQWRISN